MVLLHGVRSANNCYVWQRVHHCVVAHDKTSMWHQRHGHMNMRHMTNIIKKGAARGIPQLEETEKQYVDHAIKENRSKSNTR